MQTKHSLRYERKYWWSKNKKVGNLVREAKSLIATGETKAVAAAVGVLDAALSISPRNEAALELNARCLLFLRRFRDIADILQDYIPSYRVCGEDSSSTSLSSSGSGASSADRSERTALLNAGEEDERSLPCFCISDLKRKVIAGLHAGCEGEAQWRYLILGQACYHLGLMEDAMVLLQTSRRLASAALRRQSISHSDDMFTYTCTIPSFDLADSGTHGSPQESAQPVTESNTAAHLLAHVKLLHRRRIAATAALDAGLPQEAARHFSNILDGKRGTPHSFAVACLVGRAIAYSNAGRVADAVADCNTALAIEPASIAALRTRADLLESIRCLPECLRDLDHLKLLYEAILRGRKLPGPPWRPQHRDLRHHHIPRYVQALSERIQAVRERVSAGEGNDIDYHKLIGVSRGCARWEVERAHLVLSLRHKPAKAGAFIERLEISGEHRDLDAVRDQARMSASILYRWIQKGSSSIVSTIMSEKKRAAEASAASLAAVASSLCQGVFCRDVVAASSMLCGGIPVKYEAQRC